MRVKQASKIILIGITILALIFLVFLGLRKTQQKKLFAEIQTKYNNNNFDEALHLATQLSEPYKKYYTEFINKRKELDNWSGTDEELFQWLENYLLSADVNEDYFLPDGCQDYLIWGDIVSAERKFEEDSDSLSDAFQWYSDAYLIYKKFECEYMDLCVKNTQLFQNEYGTTVINISREEVNVYDQEMDTLYNNTMKAVNDLKNRYNSDYSASIIGDWESEIEKDYTSYTDNISLNRLYDFNDPEVYITDKSAQINYDNYCNIIKLELYDMQTFESAKQSLIPPGNAIADYENASDPAIEVGYIIHEIYPEVTVNISNTDYNNISKKWEKMIDVLN